MIIDYKVIGCRIKQVRQRKRITQEKLAETLGVSAVYISRIENGKAKLNLEMLVSIADLLETDSGYFLTGVSYKEDYLAPELDLILQDCPPEKRQLLMEISKLIAKYK
jgi:transcriptional regulator with XRE-family HTH domain